MRNTLNLLPPHSLRLQGDQQIFSLEIYLECVIDIFLGLGVVIGQTAQARFQVLEIILDFGGLDLALLDQLVDRVQLLDLVPGSLLAAHFAQSGDMVAFKAVHKLKNKTLNYGN